jgi:hypothetical protein
MHCLPPPIWEVAVHCQQDDFIDINFFYIENVPDLHPLLEYLRGLGGGGGQRRSAISLLLLFPFFLTFFTHAICCFCKNK